MIYKKGIKNNLEEMGIFSGINENPILIKKNQNQVPKTKSQVKNNKQDTKNKIKNFLDLAGIRPGLLENKGKN